MLVKVATIAFIFPDTLVDGFVADIEFAANLQGFGDLFRAPFVFEPGVNEREFCGREVAVSP